MQDDSNGEELNKYSEQFVVSTDSDTDWARDRRRSGKGRPEKNKCRHLTCPVLTAPFYGTCERPLEVLFLSISVRFRLNIDWEKSKLTMVDMRKLDFKELGKSLAKQVQSEAALGDCIRCFVSIRAQDEPHSLLQQWTSYFIIHMKYITDEQCGAEFIASQLMRLHGEETTIAVAGLEITFVMRRETDTAKKISKTSRHIFGQIDLNSMVSWFIDLRKAPFCPTIILTNEDYHDIMNNTKFTSRRGQINALFGIKRGESIISNDVARKTSVCVGDYRLALTEIHVNNAVKLMFFEPKTMCCYLLILSAFIVGALTIKTVP